MRDFSRYHVQCHMTLPRIMAELFGSRSPAFLWYPKSCSVGRFTDWGCSLPRQQRLEPLGEFGVGTVLGDVAIHIFPYCFFSYPNLNWTDGDSGGVAAASWAAYLASALNQGRSHSQCLWGARLLAGLWSRLPVENWPGEEAVPAKSSFLSGSDSCVVPLNKPVRIPECFL